jgi:endonuclease/exonuclease/phosphatase (EEP) superfamily protein YafD
MHAGTARLVSILLFMATIVVSLPLVAGLLGRLHPSFDSFAHFRWHLALALTGCSLLLLATCFRAQGVLGAVLGLAAAWTTLPGMGWTGGVAVADDVEPGPVYRLLHLNLRFNNPDPGAVLSLIGRIKPDAITLNEVSEQWRPHLELLSAMYPVQTICASPRFVGGVAILTRRPLASGTSIDCTVDGAFAVARLDFGGRWVDIAAMHLHWPWPFRQAEQIGQLSGTLAKLGGTAILAGDLNATTWSAAVARVAAAGGLTTVTGIGPTWLTPSVPAVLVDYAGLPIDQVFSKGDIRLISVATQEAVGSDHLPVLVEFSLAPEADDGGSTTAMAFHVEAAK